MGDVLYVDLWEEDAGEIYLPVADFSTIRHPLVRLYRMAGALIQLPGGKLEHLPEYENPYKKTVPHAVEAGTELFVRTSLRNRRPDPKPSDLTCGVIDDEGREMYINMTRRKIRHARPDQPFDVLLASYFDSHLAALRQQERDLTIA